MRFSHVLPYAALASAFVIPDEKVMSQIAVESHEPSDFIWDTLPSKESLLHEVEETFSEIRSSSKNAFDAAVEFAEDTLETIYETYEEEDIDASAWLENAYTHMSDDDDDPHHPHPPHKRPGKHPKHGKGRHHKPNMTVYQLIAGSKYTTKLAGLINEYDDLVELLNGTAANYTVFAPIDKAFEKIPEDVPKPSKEFLKKLLTYHVSRDFYPAGRVLVSHTIPTLYNEDLIGGEAQRLSTNIGFRGLTVNFFSRVVAINIFGTNGVIHGIDSILIPPPKAAKIIEFLPGEFSTLELALVKTGLFKAINDTSTHIGGTLFAPSNFAFTKLGPRINAFLFSPPGLKYLTALLEYHVSPNRTLYSDAYYGAKDVDQTDIPRGIFHVDLPTLLREKALSIDVARYGRLISMKINAFTTVAVLDGVAKDGVIHVVPNVLIPPKSVGGKIVEWQGEELTEEDLIERLEPFAEKLEL